MVHRYDNDLYIYQGCDASVLLASPNGKAEKDHPDNLSLAGDGFDTVIKAKAAVDSNPQCRNKVSCADILALATRDVVSLVRTYICNSFIYQLSKWFLYITHGIYRLVITACIEGERNHFIRKKERK